jgi:hypothetical protein
LDEVSNIDKRKALFTAATISTRGYHFSRDAANER